MSVNPAQENSLVAKRRAESRQDTKHPFLINIQDGRLYPHNMRTKLNPNYRVYTGDIKANLAERLRYLESAGHKVRPIAEFEPFDIGKATLEDIIAFAQDEYGEDLSKETDVRVARKKLMTLSKG